MAIFPVVVELNLVKWRQRFDCLPWDKRPTLAQHVECDVSKIKDDDDRADLVVDSNSFMTKDLQIWE